ncbi:MAG: acetate--CoA ligase family protein [Acidobacteria bacterium]|nr:acetate--CoA ligase family protein [Acidobacteriota bacterium]
MARLYEYQGKELLAEAGIAVPSGGPARTADEARAIAERLARPVVLKAQVWGTGRAGAGGIRFADSPAETAAAASELLSTTIHGSPVDLLLVEERIQFEREYYVGLVVDDQQRRPVLLLSTEGGSGIEQRAVTRPETMTRLAVSIRREPAVPELASALHRTEIPSGLQEGLARTLLSIYQVARRSEARIAEINPLACTNEGKWIALDCRILIDDYAVFRHPELGIDIAREFGHPPTELERIAWTVEKDDYRGTYYFVELADNPGTGTRIGFHGAGGGGSLASLDAAQRAGLQPANYTDTSGNPPASKVYRAARIILSQPGIRGYFLSGSGVASQEQFHMARALVKAFREDRPGVPAVLRLGGNGEEEAARIIRDYCSDLPAPVEAYSKAYQAEACAARLKELIDRSTADGLGFHAVVAPERPPVAPKLYAFETRTGRITYDHAVCVSCETKACVTNCAPGILSLEGDLPVLNITREDARRGKCIECLACEVECWFQGKGAASIELPIAGLDEYRKKVRSEK